MSPVFLDNACFIANVNRRDQYHAKAKALLDSLLEEDKFLLTTEWVHMEAGGGLRRPAFRLDFIEFVQLLKHSGFWQIIPATATGFARSWDLFSRHGDKDWSLVDCASFVTMQELGILEAFTADQHFVQAGFTALLTTSEQ